MEQPGAGKGPIILGGGNGNAQGFGDFLVGHPDKIPIHGAQTVERRGHVRVFVAEQAPPDGEGFRVGGFRLGQPA